MIIRKMRTKILKKIVGATILSVVVLIGCGGGSSDSFTDRRDGKTYRIVTIGSQTWMAENLNFATDSGSWCYDNCDTYGRLYDWNTALTVCPKGWRLPTDEEWGMLIKTVGGEAVAGTKLKSTTDWRDNGNGTDEFGFSALPGGSYVEFGGGFLRVGYSGDWWSATEYDATNARERGMDSGNEKVTSYGLDKGNGHSVRCIKD